MIREQAIRSIEKKLDLIIRNQETIMSNQTSIAAQLTAVQGSLTSIATGVTALDTAIQNLQAQVAANSGDNLTPATQALLDQVAAQSASLAQTASTMPGAIPPVTTP